MNNSESQTSIRSTPSINGIKKSLSNTACASSSITDTLKYDIKRITKWDVSYTIKWLKSVGYEDCENFFREHRINGRALLMLNEDDLKEVIKHNVGQRKNLYHLIKTIQIRYQNFMASSSYDEDELDDDDQENDANYYAKSPNRKDKDDGTAADDEYDLENQSDTPMRSRRRNSASTRTSTSSSSCSSSNNSTVNESPVSHSNFKNNLGSGLGLRHRSHGHSNNNNSNINNMNGYSFANGKGTNRNKKYLVKRVAISHHPDEDESNEDETLCDSCLKKVMTNGGIGILNSHGSFSPVKSHRGEKRKTLLSVFYLFISCLWTSFVLTVVHDRVPDMEKYPPLPDLILDNIPLIPWAFFATECIGLLLVIFFFGILIFHKHRLIIFRRICSLGSTIFFLRSITMLITSLSVPGVHIQCSSQRYGSLVNKVRGAWTILSGVGLYLQGVRTCGDYMFSGHTVWLTLLTHFITEYTPMSMNWFHTMTWVFNMFGLFFILAAHEHYSIDVFIAFYISSRLFVYYHSLANNQVLFQGDHKQVKIWFPLFSYFESNIRYKVPNVFQWPPNVFYLAYKSVKSKVKRLLNLVVHPHKKTIQHQHQHQSYNKNNIQ